MLWNYHKVNNISKLFSWRFHGEIFFLRTYCIHEHKIKGNIKQVIICY